MELTALRASGRKAPFEGAALRLFVVAEDDRRVLGPVWGVLQAAKGVLVSRFSVQRAVSKVPRSYGCRSPSAQ